MPRSIFHAAWIRPVSQENSNYLTRPLVYSPAFAQSAGNF